MNPNLPFYPPQPSFAFSAVVPFDTSPMHQAALPGGYTYGYNDNWGPAQQHAFLHNVNQVTVESSTPGVAVTTNNGWYRCLWLTAGGPCNHTLADFDKLILHLGSEHDVSGTASLKLYCQWSTAGGCCGKRYRRDGFRRHIGTHVGLSVTCTECGKSFSRKDSMRAHAKKHHGKV